MDTFETSTVMNKAALNDIKHHLMTSGRKAVMLAIVLLALCLTIFGIILQHTLLISLSAAAAALFIAEYFFIVNRNVKQFLKRLEESQHIREYSYTTSFTDEGMKIINHTTGNSFNIFYGDIRSVQETARYYLVFTRANQFTLVDRIAIDTAGKREAFRAFLLSRNADIRWKQRRG